MGKIEDQADIVLALFKRRSILTNLDGSEENEFNQHLASVSTELARGPEDQETMMDKVQQLVLDSDSDASFDTFSDDQRTK